jgi:hypothetical protein
VKTGQRLCRNHAHVNRNFTRIDLKTLDFKTSCRIYGAVFLTAFRHEPVSLTNLISNAIAGFYVKSPQRLGTFVRRFRRRIYVNGLYPMFRSPSIPNKNLFALTVVSRLDITSTIRAVAERGRPRICWGEDSECDLMINFMRREAAEPPKPGGLFFR